MIEIQTIISDDGSHTLYMPKLNESYHSKYGAVTESKHVFIQAGFCHLKNSQPVIFEVGFGTGLNALLTCFEAEKQKRDTLYYAIEKYPLEKVITANLNYADISGENGREIFNSLHMATWGKQVKITPYFTIHKIKGDLLTHIHNTTYDLIYFDAFAPEKQPDMWDENIFSILHEHTNEKGILTTYCAKGKLKRILKNLGYEVESLPGPPGKREMIRATKTLEF